MEYVEGEPITAYCRRKQLNLTQRMKLFRTACEAVGYAHRNLTVHLDLKPANILVDSEGNVKLLDFGIGKNLERGETEPEVTRTGLRLFSLNYAAPEQIAGQPVNVQTDIHGLGIVLYELLAGRVPADLSNASAVELARHIEEEAPRPSAAAKGHPNAVKASKAAWRDLDLLCLTAMHRDQTRRYESVDAMIRDIDHFLKNEPLQAQRKLGYLLRKFLVRHRRPIVATAAVLTTIVALSLFFTFRLIDARNRAVLSEARMQRVYRLMLNLFEGDDDVAGPAEGLRVVSLLDRGVHQADSLKEDPGLQADVQYTFGTLYHKLGRADRAEPLLRSSLAGLKTQFGSAHPDTLKAQLALALLLADQAMFDEAERLAQEALDITQRNFSADGMEVAKAQAALGRVAAIKGDYKLAVPTLESAVKTLSAGDASVELSEALTDLVNTHYYLGHLEMADDLNRKSLALDQKLFGDRHPNVAVDLYNQANMQLDRGQYQEAEQSFRHALDIVQVWYGPVHPKTASNLLMLGRSLSYQQRFDDASALYNQAASIFRTTDGERSVRHAVVLSFIAELARDRNHLDAADEGFRQAAAIFKNTVGEQHEFYVHQLSNLGSVLLARRRYREAEEILKPALSALQAAVPDTRVTAIAQMRLAAALEGQMRYAEAERMALAGYATLQKRTALPAGELVAARKFLRGIYEAMKQPEKAKEFASPIEK